VIRTRGGALGILDGVLTAVAAIRSCTAQGSSPKLNEVPVLPTEFHGTARVKYPQFPESCSQENIDVTGHFQTPIVGVNSTHLLAGGSGMQNAHERFGHWKFIKRTKDTTTRSGFTLTASSWKLQKMNEVRPPSTWSL